MKLLPHLLACCLYGWLAASPSARAQEPMFDSWHQLAVSGELKSVKVFGAGGLGLDAYQSGFFVSAEGHILTVWSTVLDVSDIIAVSSDGRRLQAQVVAVDPNLEIAILKANQPPPAFFSLDEAVDAVPGERVLAISNLFAIAAGNEMSSVQKGVVMTITDLKARRGNFQSVYQGPAMIIDAMTNNPGAAGGALINMNGQLLGMLGKELRDTNASIWINYAVPISQLKSSVDSLLEGKSIARSLTARRPADRPLGLPDLGIVLIPNILTRTPAFIDLVEPGSRAAMAGLRPDDLILFLNSQRIVSQSTLLDELQYLDRGDPVQMLIQRGSQLTEVMLLP